jgi:hypothetical protein
LLELDMAVAVIVVVVVLRRKFVVRESGWATRSRLLDAVARVGVVTARAAGLCGVRDKLAQNIHETRT